jgi:hypothetical protein
MEGTLNPTFHLLKKNRCTFNPVKFSLAQKVSTPLNLKRQMTTQSLKPFHDCVTMNIFYGDTEALKATST